MAGIYLQTPTVNHNFEKYSKENILKELHERQQINELEKEKANLAKNDDLKALCEVAKKELDLYEKLAEEYSDEFSVLYRIRTHAFEGDEEGKNVLCEFKEIPFTAPEILPEEYDVTLKDKQLELECTFEDGTKFGLSALARNGDSKQVMGQINLPDETLKNLNEERLKRILDFCEKNGFSIFSLDIPMHGGEIDVDEKIQSLQSLLDDYKKSRADEMESHPGPDAPTEEADDDRGFDEKEYNILEATLSAENTNQSEEEKTPTTKKSADQFSLDDMHDNIVKFIEKDLHKKRHLSYWEHYKRINGRKTYVFSIYDREDPDNYRNDGKNDPNSKDKKHQHIPTYAYRLYLSQEPNGKLVFGYATPGGKKMDDVMAGDYIGEIKKAGITHLNFRNIPNHDKMVWMVACAEKGIVPTGLSFTQAKVQKMLESAKAKLSTQEFAMFQNRLMVQWEENAAKKGTPLAVSEQEFIETKKNDSRRLLEHQSDKLEAAAFDRQFENFRKSYNATGGLHEIVDEDIRQASQDRKEGAAKAVAAMQALYRTFDVFMGNDRNLEKTVGERLEEVFNTPVRDRRNPDKVILVRLTATEKRALESIPAGKKLKDLDKEDINLLYNTLFTRQFEQAKKDIVDKMKEDEAARAHRADPVLLGDVWSVAVGNVSSINRILKRDIGVDALDLPEKHYGLFYERPEELKYKNVLKKEAEKKAKEEAKNKEAAKEPAAKSASPSVTPLKSAENTR